MILLVVLTIDCGNTCYKNMYNTWKLVKDLTRMQLISGPHTYHGDRCLHHIIAVSYEGQEKEAECNRIGSSDVPTYHSILQGFVCEFLFGL